MPPVEYCPFPRFRFLYPLEFPKRTDHFCSWVLLLGVVSLEVEPTDFLEVSVSRGWLD